MLMVILGIMISHSKSLLVGRVADTGERIIESKLLECLRFDDASSVVACRQGWAVLGLRRS
jgi:hypothetical protein